MKGIESQEWLRDIPFFYLKENSSESFSRKLEILKEYEDLDPHNYHLHMLKGHIMEKNHKLHEAIQCYKQASELNPGFL